MKSPNVVPYFGHDCMTSPNTSAKVISAYLRGREIETEELKQICQQQFTLSYQEITADSYFDTITLMQLLVHSGYFSIASLAKKTGLTT